MRLHYETEIRGMKVTLHHHFTFPAYTTTLLHASNPRPYLRLYRYLYRLPSPYLTPNCNAAAHAVATESLASLRTALSSLPPRPPSYSTSSSSSTPHPESPDGKTSVLHPRVAVLLGVERRWHLPLLFCRALSTAPAVWWGLRCALMFMGEMLLEEEFCVEGRESAGAQWCVERRFRVTEVFLAVVWCCASAYLSFFFTDCLMSRWLLNYTPQATLVRLLTINSMNAYITSWVLYLSGGSEDPCLLLPAWISIATTLTFMYHITHPRLAILKETSHSISVFSIASFISMATLLVQLHLSRESKPPVPMFLIARQLWEWFKIGVGAIGRIGREL